MSFDPTDKKNKSILNYFEDKKVLIIHESPGLRASLKKMMVLLGVKVTSIYEEKNIAETLPNFLIISPSIVISSYEDELDLLQRIQSEHVNLIPDRTKALFYIIAEHEHLIDISFGLDFEFDGILILPITTNSFIDTLVKTSEDKINLSKANALFFGGLSKFYEQDYLISAKKFDLACELEPKHYKSMFYHALSKYKALLEANEEGINPDDEDEIINLIKKVIKVNPYYFKALNFLKNHYIEKKNYIEAYEYSRVIFENYSSPLNELVTLVRLSIASKRYEDIVKYQNYYNKVNRPKPELQQVLSAGIIIYAKHLIQNSQLDRIEEVLKVALKNSNGKFEIFEQVMTILIEKKMTKIFLNLFDTCQQTSWPLVNESLKLYALHMMTMGQNEIDNNGTILKYANELLTEKVNNYYVYKVIIERSVEAKRNQNQLDILKQTTLKLFPDKKDEIEGLFLK